MQYKYITYPINKWIDKEKDDPDQDFDKGQADVANNKDDQCCDKKCHNHKHTKDIYHHKDDYKEHQGKQL